MLTAPRFVALVIAMAANTLASTSLAQAPAGEATSQHAVVIWVEGGGAKKDAEAREAIGRSLPASVRVVDESAFRKAMTAAGQKLPYAPLLGKGPFRRAALDRTRKALAEVGAEGAILGNIRIGKSGQEVVVLYIEAGDSGQDPDVEAPIPIGTPDLRGSVSKALDTQIQNWSAGAATVGESPKKDAPKDEPEKKDDEKKPDDDEKNDEEGASAGDERPKNQYGREIFSIAANFDLGGRWFAYNDPVTPNLRNYDVFPAAGFDVGAEVYPLATTDVPVLKDLGFFGGFGMALGLASETAGGEEVTTSWTRFDVGMRFRLRTGSEKAPVLGLHGGFAIDSFDLKTDGELAGEVPTVSYTFLKVGVDGRIPIGPVALSVFFDYLGAVSAGEVYDRFQGSSIGGIAAGGAFIVPIAAGFEARVGAEYDRWFYAFEPVVGDAYVAGGALDEYLHLTVGPAYVF